MSLTFKDLENFITVAKSRTLSEASEKLDMAQPSLSLGIKKMEKELGLPLFTRGRSGIKLTPQGKMILPKAEEALRLMFQIKGAPTNLSFKIGCHPSVGMFVLGEFLRSMHRLAPKLNLEIVNGPSHEINKKVAQGEVDFGIVMNPLPVPGLVTRFIGEDMVHVWESKDRYQDSLILNPEMIQSNSILSRWKDAPGTRVEVPNLELISHLVDSGAGYGIIPSQVVKAQRLNLKKVPNTPTYKDRLAVVCFPEIIKSMEGKLIFEELKKSFKA
ncbi:LysR family transcriptional regulator [Peredibacter starrii]|uniref:LysR family transcriptional regulator n=1 Tax=Peredibacter starrii TaxID=28202 RepID=A0AAX4HUQ4_9BACT|nr:LysR family transcriptional regulator [Peredibacter starrii]WPU67022.1 LysR family transcriptional regulator [Peredibacter starrii]